MSFKDGIPLLTSLDDEETETEDDFAVEVGTSRRRLRWSRKHVLFAAILALVVFVVIAVIVAVTVPVVVLQGGGEVSPNGINEYKPTLDDRTYKVLTLSNSLRVLLISDPNSNVSAASMEVAAGSFSDPHNAEGLAHFCEHMLFLGTEKYPNQHEYSQFLTSHGGYDNAFTSTQETNYYFSVDSAYLKHTLDLFAQFFIAPLFEESSVEGEVHAVNAEHEKNLQSDGWKLWQLLKHVSNPQHPFHMFSTGSLSTLNNTATPLLPLLRTYYDSNYSANTLQLAVYGRDSIETLTKWTETYFTEIPNRSVSPQTFPKTAFPPEYSGKLVFHYPVADTNTLYLYWQTEPLQSLYRNDVTEFLSRYLGNEGPGSILNYLKASSWATLLSAGSEVDADSFTLLTVNIQLTVKGLDHVSEIVRSVFEFIRLLSNQTDESLKTLWDEHTSVSQVVYDYSEEAEPVDYALTLAQRMRLVTDPDDFLGNPHRLVLNTSLVRTVLSSLTPANSLVFVGTHHVNFSEDLNITAPHFGPPSQNSPVNLPWPDLDKREPIYSTPFTIVDIPSDLKTYWSGGSGGNVPELHLPGENHFIPQNFSILSPPSNHAGSPVKVELANIHSGVSLWWLQDTAFQTPHVNMYCSINANQSNASSVRWSELTTLYTLLATEVLTPILYPAAELTYSTSLFATPTGLHLEFSGFSDPQVMQRYINTTVTYMKDFDSMEKVFDIVKENRKVFLENYNLTTLPYRYIYRYLQQVIMERPYWKHEEELLETRSITDFAEVKDHAMKLFSDASFLCFAHGNINQEQAERYTELVVNKLSPSPSPDTPRGGYQRRRVALSEPGTYGVTLPTLNPNDENSAVNVIYQIGPTCDVTGTDSNCSPASIATAARLGLLTQIVGDECFNQLRTIEQLGYVAFCFQNTYSAIGSFQVVVQSQEYNASYVLREINRFLENFGSSTIDTLTDSALNTQRELYASTLRKKSQTLTEESDRLWGEIVTGREQFDYNYQIIRALSGTTAKDIRDFYSHHITNSTQFKKLVVGVYGEGKEVDFSDDFSYCIDYGTLDHSISHYPTSDPSMNCTMS
jgi:insulysin